MEQRVYAVVDMAHKSMCRYSFMMISYLVGMPKKTFTTST